jgi:AmmeMemoRadiSam system protein B/AmmeMemoRadiSam system protein A
MNRNSVLGRVALLLLVCALLSCGVTVGTRAQDTREPVGPGQFYPRSSSTLKAAVQAMLADAVPPRPETPVAIVVPHAGYVFSGQIAADGFRQAAGHLYETVVIIGTNHTSATFRKIGICPGTSFRTPLGSVPIDQKFVAALQKEDDDCVMDAGVHRTEHSVEVQVPFVQHLFPNAKIVPLIVGRPDQAMSVRLGRALATLAKGSQVLLVASSDLSHYPKADDASRVDRRTLETIASLDVDAFYRNEFADAGAAVPELVTHACGAGAIMAVMTAARSLGATHAVVVSYANSGDTTAGDSARTVGYGAVAFTSGPKGADVKVLEPVAADTGALQAEDRKALLAFARNTITRYLTTETFPLARRGLSPRTLQERGVFVTLNEKHELRGCIGNIRGGVPLGRLVGAMAYAAAFEDPRFEPVRLEEMRDIEIEISILSPPRTVSGPSDIVVGRDGVVIAADNRSAVFLPQVAPEQGWNRDQMLDNLCIKAGLAAGRWRRPSMTFATFQADVFHEGQ